MDQIARTRASGPVMPLSLEASLDEENKEVLAHLNRTGQAPKTPRGRTPPPYRSMLDVDDSNAPRHGSIAGIGVGITSPRDQRKASKRLDPSDPTTWTSSHHVSAASREQPSADHSGNNSMGVGVGAGLPKIQVDSKEDFEQKYNFDMASMPLSGGGAKPSQSQKPREGSSTDRRNARDTKPSALQFRTASPGVANMLNPDSPKSKPRTSPGSFSEGTRRRLSDKSGSFSTADGSEEVMSRVMADVEGEEDAVAESSSEEERRQTSSDDDEGSPESQRGRTREKNEPAPEEDKESTEERKLAPQSQGVRSLIEPLLSPSYPGEKTEDIHPTSSFGRSGPTAADFADDDDDVESDIQKAKSLGLSISPLDDTIQDRHVRMIIRGEWSKFQDESENNNNSSPRLYLACTDLSTEATYAMEWTIGTMLRDGDTLLAIYAMEDETAPKEPEGNTQVMTESAKAAQDASDAMEALTKQTTAQEQRPATKFIPAIDAPTLAGSTNTSNMSKKEVERLKALDEITGNFLKLVRKTPLQVRCMIEVIHCKSPKHLIINAVDELEPTLCVVGTRGRSSIKGVLLGSFSNYLVMKSSVPVMVARRKLKKPGQGRVSSAQIRLSNNLSGKSVIRPRRSLTQARID